jgi:predicted nucleotidyltransferase
MPILRQEVLQTLLYYDLWRHPLTLKELHAFLPVRYPSIVDFERTVRTVVEDGTIAQEGNLYYLPGEGGHPPAGRRRREKHARWMWRAAALSTHVIKRCPFVRGVFVSGELSKGSTGPGSDIDFLIVTAPGRVWIARALLIIFKKTFLLNSKKFFCVNSFISTDHLEVEERNIYQATEVAHLKATHNAGLLHSYHEANRWILDFFPNFNAANLAPPHSPRSRSSVLQKLFEFPFLLLPADRIDTWLMRAMERVWARRYPQFDEQTRARIFRCTRQESRAYAGNYQERILAQYDERLLSRGVAD